MSLRLVAVKIIPRDRDIDRTHVGFIREVEVLRACSHHPFTSLLTDIHLTAHRPTRTSLSLVPSPRQCTTPWSSSASPPPARQHRRCLVRPRRTHSPADLVRALQRRCVDAPHRLCPPQHQARKCVPFYVFSLLDSSLLVTHPPPLSRSSNSPTSASPSSSTPTPHSPAPAATSRPTPHVTTGRAYDHRGPCAIDAWGCGIVLFAVCQCVRRLPFGDAPAGERSAGGG